MKKIVVVGGTGRIGARLVSLLRERGHVAVSASPSSGVNALTGAGLEEALAGAGVVIDVSNPPPTARAQAREFFETSSRKLLAAEQVAGVEHHVVLSIVGVDRLPGNDYFGAKVVQEEVIKSSGMPYTIARATQFFEFIQGIADAATRDGAVRVAPALLQPIAADDVAAILADFASSRPSNNTIDVAGPESFRLDELIRLLFRAAGDKRPVVADPNALYFGAALDDRSLRPLGEGRVGTTRFADWLSA